MRLRAVAVLCALAGLSVPAEAEPCPLFVMQPAALQPEVAASPEGGIVVGELPTPQAGPSDGPDDRSGWALRVKGKRLASNADAIAPGLVVYRPPAGASEWELVDGRAKRRARAKLVKGKQPDLLEAPVAARITSGTTQSRHPDSFVSVELSTPAPKDAIALVLSKVKGPAYSWGQASKGLERVSVFSTGSGCFGTHSNGTVQAQPGESVTLFWVDVYGRRSRVTQAMVVEKP